MHFTTLIATALVAITPILAQEAEPIPTVAAVPQTFWANIFQDSSSCDGHRQVYMGSGCKDFLAPTTGSVKLVKGDAITGYSGPGCTGKAVVFSKNVTADCGSVSSISTGFDVLSFKDGSHASTNATV